MFGFYLTWIFFSLTSHTYEEDISTDSMRFDFTMLQEATSHFSVENKLGEGGFGAVYKVS